MGGLGPKGGVEEGSREARFGKLAGGGRKKRDTPSHRAIWVSIIQSDNTKDKK
jgi:hypothetical protein